MNKLAHFFQFHWHYFLTSLFLLVTLIVIATFINDSFVRPFLGDALVVIWMYALLKAFIKATYLQATVFVLLFSYLIEIAQYFKLVELLGLQDIEVARIIIGATFDWMDFVAYTTGAITVLIIEYYRNTFFRLIIGYKYKKE